MSAPRHPQLSLTGHSSLTAILGWIAIRLLTGVAPIHAAEIDFEKDIWPIFQQRCQHCHDGDLQEGQLRLDARQAFFSGGVSGQLIDVKHPARSLLMTRLRGEGDLDQMPLDEEPLSDEQLQTLQDWIKAGARWPESVGVQVTPSQLHWAYRPPRRPAWPASLTTNWGPAWSEHPIDRFVAARMHQQGLQPNPPAAPEKLLRRLYLDLTGLPPTLEELEQFLADPSAAAYEQVVDRLLASPAFGEKWSRGWLDLGRYADTNGFQADQFRSVWPYRDWVIAAINADMPFDQFTIEQLAGDLLPNATVAQKIATGFHRLTTCNVEAGVDPEENRVNQIFDRINTTGTVWFGTTFECMQCHNHKYDPFTQREYYQMFAFFNQTPIEVKNSGNDIQYEFHGPAMDLPMTQKEQQLRQSIGIELERLKTEQQCRESHQAAAFEAWLKQEHDQSPPKQRQKLKVQFLRQIPEYREAEALIKQLQTQWESLQPKSTLVMIDSEQRETAVFKRGNFLDRGEMVQPGTPRILHHDEDNPLETRLDFARWVVDRENPLTARVVINRWWQEIFGRGIVATSEDFGTQGEPPSHPELLDYLAIEFMESGWSRKRLIKQIVLSRTYRQSSRFDEQKQETDPRNIYLARGPRFRMPAEMLRDHLLTVSGNLGSWMGGPPVYPPQPAGIWRHVGRNAPKYETSSGTDRFRRGIYVFWRRSAPYPSFVNFDAPDRASCVVQRPRTNTPLQALTLLNDEAFFELATEFARDLDARPGDLPDKIAEAFQACTMRQPDDREADSLTEFFNQRLEYYRSHPEKAEAVSGQKVRAAEQAAWINVVQILFNLDETISKD